MWGRMHWIQQFQDRDKYWTFVISIMYVYMKIGPFLLVYCSQTLIKFGDRLGAEPNFETVSDVAVTQKVGRSIFIS
jgi:hypothetical protein